MTQDALIPTPTSLNLNPQQPRREHPARHLDSRQIHATWCRTCKTPILRGLDDPIGAFTIRVDPTPLTPIGELLAQLAERRTVEVRRTGFIRRTRWNIPSRPAGTVEVYPEHHCGSPPLPQAPSLLDPAKRQRADPNQPPPF